MAWILRAVIGKRLGGFWGFVAFTFGGILWAEWRRRGGLERLGRRLEDVGQGLEEFARTEDADPAVREGTGGLRKMLR